MFIQVDFFQSHSTTLGKVLAHMKTPEGYADLTPFFSLNCPSLPAPRTLVFWGNKIYRISEIALAPGPNAARASVAVAMLYVDMSVV